MHDPLFVLPALVGIGVGAQWIASRLRVPAIVPLLLIGLLLGPVGGVVHPARLFGGLLEPLVALAVAVVLFEGGLSLRFAEVRRLGRPLALLVLAGPTVTFGASAVLAHELAHLCWPTAFVLGAILIVTGPTVVQPMLRQARLRARPALLLKWESIVNDPLGALLAVGAVGVVADPPGAGPGSAVLALPGATLAAGSLGVLVALWLGRAMDGGTLGEHLKVPAIFAGVLGTFAVGEALHSEAGLLAVTAMGIALANGSSPNVHGIRHFKEDITTLLVAFLFLVLSADLDREQLASLRPGDVAFVLALLFVVRPLSVALALGSTRIPVRETTLIGWIAPRGVVAAAMGGALAPRLQQAGLEDASRLVPVLFLVVLASVLLHGLTIGPLARRLGLAASGSEGILITGASRWVLELARTLQQAGTPVVVVDDDYRRVSYARRQALEAFYGDVLSEETLSELPLERLNWFLAATPDDAYNALACTALRREFGQERTLALTPARDEPFEGAVGGRSPWGAAGRYTALAARFWSGGGFATTELTDDYTWEDFQAHHPDALVLFWAEAGRLRLPVSQTPPQAGTGIVFQKGVQGSTDPTPAPPTRPLPA